MEIEVKDLIGIVGIVLSFGFIITNLISNRKLAIISLIIFLVVGGSLALRIFRNDLFVQYLNFIPNPQNTLVIAAGGCLLISFLELLILVIKRNNRLKIARQGEIYDDSRILAYLTKSNKMFQYSKQIEEIKRGLREEDGQFKIQKVFFENNEIPLKYVLKTIARCGDNINEPSKFKIKYSNGFDNDLDLIKKPITKNPESKKVIGYALIDNTTSNSVKIELEKIHKRNLFIYLNLLNQPIAYYDHGQNGYVITNHLSKLLAIDSRVITVDNFKKLMHPEDINEYESNKSVENKLNQRFFRLKSGNSYFWFEEAVVNYFETDFIILKKTDASFTIDLQFEGYKAMVKQIENHYANNLDFGIVVINMNSLPEITTNMGTDYSTIIVNKFFTAIINSNLKEHVKVYKIGAIEFALVIEGQEYVDLTIRSLDNNQSLLLSQDVYVNRKRNRIQCQVGLVASQDIASKDTRVIIKAAFDTIKEATDANFGNNYSIYQPIVIVEKEYNLKDLGIDLNEDLNEFIEILDKE